MFGVENSANNFGRSAGLLSNLYSEIPIRAALGTLFIASDTLIVYRWNGTAWDLIGGGGGVFGGVTNGLQVIGSNVGLGGSLTQNTDINCFNYNFKFEVFNSFAIGDGTEPTMIWNSSAQTIITSFGGNQIGLNLNFAGNQMSLKTGDNTIFVLSNGSGYIAPSGNDQCFIFANYDLEIGDSSGFANGVNLQIFNSTEIIRTQHNVIGKGLKLDFFGGQYWLGDYDNLTNQYWLRIDDVAGQLDLNGANLISGSASGFSGNHLSIYINSTHYKIKLENP